MTDAYAAAKFLNAAVMSAAVFPTYWLARRIVRPSFALLTAAAAVATPAMVYHAFLMSEALAYPVFLLDRRRPREGARGTAQAGWRSRYPAGRLVASRRASSS